jgi:tetratricopeptide (TPR) repeat protein
MARFLFHPLERTKMSELERFTKRSRHVLSLSQDIAETRRHGLIDVPHVLLALFLEDGGLASKLLHETFISEAELTSILEQGVYPQLTDHPNLSDSVKRMLELAVNQARKWGHHYIGTEHLLLGVIRCKHPQTASLFERAGLSVKQVEERIRALGLEWGQSSTATSTALDSWLLRLGDFLARGTGFGFFRKVFQPPMPVTIPLETPPDAEVIAYYTQRIAERPENVPLRLARARAYVEQKNFSAALEDCTGAVRLDPGNAQAHYLRAICRISLEDRAGAIEDLSVIIDQVPLQQSARVVTPAPYYGDACYARGVAYLMIGEAERARADFSRVIGIAPRHTASYAQRAYCDLLSLNYDAATADLQRALALDPKSQLALAYMAEMDMERGSLDQAGAHITTAMHKNAGTPYTIACWSWLQLRQAKLDEAFVSAEKSLSLRATEHIALYVRGKVYAERGERNKAVADFELALKYYPNQEFPLHKPYIDEMKAYLAQE